MSKARHVKSALGPGQTYFVSKGLCKEWNVFAVYVST